MHGVWTRTSKGTTTASEAPTGTAARAGQDLENQGTRRSGEKTCSQSQAQTRETQSGRNAVRVLRVDRPARLTAPVSKNRIYARLRAVTMTASATWRIGRRLFILCR